MSTLYSGTIPCGGCGAPVAVPLADSLNANRMPAARDWVLERTLMTATCTCGAQTTAIQPVLYVDFERKLWIQAVEDDRRPAFPACEAEVRTQFAEAFDTTRFPAFIAVWRDQIQPRVVFGYEELREKVVAADHDLDDAILEVLKLELLVAQPHLVRGGVQVLLLEKVVDDALRFRGLTFDRDGRAQLGAELDVRRSAHDGLAARRDELARTYPALFGGCYVNAQRYRFAA
jgi:hypothetical protein